MRLEVLAAAQVAMLPLTAACTDSLKQFQEVSLDYQTLCSQALTAKDMKCHQTCTV